MLQIDVFSTAYTFQEDDMRDKTVVVVDVLRASSTIITALQNGAKEVIPVQDMSDAGKMAQNLDQSRYLLCGERDGVKIEGYHLGNSPLEYTPNKIKGKTLILNSTNGTLAITRSAHAQEVLIAGFLNLSTVVEHLRENKNKEIIIVCAGSKNRVSLEDTLCAGMIIQRLTGGKLQHESRDGAKMAFALSERFGNDVEGVVQSSNHAARLRDLGYEQDIPYCAQIDITEVLPILKEGTITNKNG